MTLCENIENNRGKENGEKERKRDGGTWRRKEREREGRGERKKSGERV